MRVVLSGGGTGGHIMPALAVAEALQKYPLFREKPELLEILYIGATTGIETKIVPPLGISFQAVTTEKLRKTLSISTVKVAFSLLRGYQEAKVYLKAFRPDICIGTGGYVAAATVFAAHRLHIPTFIHEGNLTPGRTNLWLSHFADKIGVTFADTQGFPPKKRVVTGFPIRESIVLPETVSQQQARCTFRGMTAEKFTVFVTGGSQGAGAINLALLEAASRLIGAGMQIVHHTGMKNFEKVQAEANARNLSDGYVPIAFLDGLQMANIYRGADIVVCRGGISTLAEALANRLPQLIVPLPTAYADHQTHNAQAVAKTGAALHLPESGFTPDTLVENLLSLQNDPHSLKTMQDTCSILGNRHAADLIAEWAIERVKMK